MTTTPSTTGEKFERLVAIMARLRGPGGCPIWGTGAWEVGVRYDYLDLSNHGINGGIEQGLTLGLNWFLNPNFKIQANYEIGFRDLPQSNASGTYQGFGVRFAFDW